ncbi:MAG: hypothetical protein J5I93_15960, partial [Pirellulaceae bacterium]|nr:hypothetical protein [Pirellulaceae bacterium]
SMSQDAVAVTEGAGKDIATDLVGGYNYQWFKLMVGAADTVNPLAVGAGSVDTGTPRFTLAADDPAVVSLAILDDWDESDRCKVNLIASQAGITGGAGAVAANTPRVTLASDDPAVGLLTTIDADIGTIDTDTGNIATSVGVLNGGATPLFDADGDNTAQTIKGSAGVLYSLEVQNVNAVDCWIQLFDESGSITVGTTTPKASFLVPAGDGTKRGAMDKVFTVPLAFSNSIKYACTTTPTGNGDPSTGLVVNASYK